jgi:hypothetical protein
MSTSGRRTRRSLFRGHHGPVHSIGIHFRTALQTTACSTAPQVCPPFVPVAMTRSEIHSRTPGAFDIRSLKKRLFRSQPEGGFVWLAGRVLSSHGRRRPRRPPDTLGCVPLISFLMEYPQAQIPKTFRVSSASVWPLTTKTGESGRGQDGRRPMRLKLMISRRRRLARPRIHIQVRKPLEGDLR